MLSCRAPPGDRRTSSLGVEKKQLAATSVKRLRVAALFRTENSPGFVAGDHHMLHTLDRVRVLRTLEG
jgi:hypothetical protein